MLGIGSRSVRSQPLDDRRRMLPDARHVPRGVDDLNRHNRELARALQRDGRIYVASAEIGGKVYLRPCFVNFRTDDDDVLALIEIASEVGNRLAG